MSRKIFILLIFLAAVKPAYPDGDGNPLKSPKSFDLKAMSYERILPEGRGILRQGVAYRRLLLSFAESPDQKDLAQLGITGIVGEEKTFSAYVPVTNIGKLNKTFASLKSVEKEIPPKPLAFPAGEEVSLYNTFSFTMRGYTGANVKVAVIDGGFYKFSTAVAQSRIPPNVKTVNFSTGGFEADEGDGSEHGTAVAEIIHEIAPEAELHLIKISDSGGMLSAKNYCINQGIDIVNHSMGWFVNGWGEGDGFIYRQVVFPLFEEGVAWINSAGNEAENTYVSSFIDVDHDGYHDFDGLEYGIISNVSAGQIIALYLNWDAYDAFTNKKTFSDYDIELYEWSGGSPLDSSEEIQPGNSPVEVIYYDSAMSSGRYKYKIRKKSGSGTENFRVMSYHKISPRSSQYSIMSPGDGEYAFCVGAVAFSNWNTNVKPRYYSSRGPAMDNRIKPDVVGIDGMTNLIYGRFTGTSASSPSVAGLAALILSKEPYLKPDQLMHRFRDNAIDVGISGPDSDTGYGKVTLGLFPLRRNTVRMADEVIVNSVVKADERKIYYYGVEQGASLILRTLDGRILQEENALTGVFQTGRNYFLIKDGLPRGAYLLEIKGTEKTHVVKKIVLTD